MDCEGIIFKLRKIHYMHKRLLSLIEGDNFKFGNPLAQFFGKLKDGLLSLDVAEVMDVLKKANYKEYKDQQRQYTYNLLQDILISRKKLIEAAYNLPPDYAVKMQQVIAKPKDATLLERTRLRYFSLLQDVREEVGELDTSSEDENYPESNVPKVFKKYKKNQQLYEASISPDISRITATTFSPGYPGSCLEMFEVSEERYRDMLMTHKLRKMYEPTDPRFQVSNLDVKEVIARANVGKRPLNRNSDNSVRKKTRVSENADKGVNSTLVADSVESESFSNTLIREESSYNSSGPDTTSDIMMPSVQETEVQTDPLTILEEAEDSQAVFDSQNQSVKAVSPKPEPQQHPTCFFALLRDIFCESAEQKLSAIKLEEKVRNWQGGPTAPLSEWLNYQESWSDLVSSALKFLAGDLINILPDTFVPFLDYKEKQQQWQWIGSGRDSDEQMYGLCQQWLENKDDITSDILETCQGSPPPPRVITGWTVRPTAEEEKKAYREQECIRYQNPHKAFTFKVHGYEAVVGPVKGVYGKESGINKAREHSLLTSDRPPFVTILSLVRDSAARLPNGEGTRADICELLKDSQYLAPASDQQIHTVVSGALDRLHYEKDPCVKYDVNRKLWIYLHRHRTEEEFERIHQAQAAAAKARKAVQKSKLPKFKNKDIARALTTVHTVSVSSSNSESGPLLNVDAPSSISAQSARGGNSSPRTQKKDPGLFVGKTMLIYNDDMDRWDIAGYPIVSYNEPNPYPPGPSMTFTTIKEHPKITGRYIKECNKEQEENEKEETKRKKAQKRTFLLLSHTPEEGSPKLNHTPSRYVMHTLSTPSQAEIKCAVLSVENQMKTEVTQNDPTTNINSSTDNKQTIASIIAAQNQEINNSRQPNLASALQLGNAKSTINNVAATQIVSVTPVHLKQCKTEPGLSVNASPSQVHDVLNVDMKPSSPSFVGQPPVLQPILSHTNVEVSNSHTNVTSATPPLISTTAAPIAKTKVNCTNLPSLPGTIAGFQTIVIKQEPGIRPCNSVSTIPLLSIEERLPSTNPSALAPGPVVARLVHGSQYLSFCNIAANSTTSSATKPITAAVQNFRVQGGNICPQVLSTSTIKVINSTPVSAIADTRVPVIALKNQISTGKEPTILTQSPAALNVCGRLYQMANIRNAMLPKELSESKPVDAMTSKDAADNAEKGVKDVNITAVPIPTISYSAAVPITARTTQTVLKVSPK